MPKLCTNLHGHRPSPPPATTLVAGHAATTRELVGDAGLAEAHGFHRAKDPHHSFIPPISAVTGHVSPLGTHRSHHRNLKLSTTNSMLTRAVPRTVPCQELCRAHVHCAMPLLRATSIFHTTGRASPPCNHRRVHRSSLAFAGDDRAKTCDHTGGHARPATAATPHAPPATITSSFIAVPKTHVRAELPWPPLMPPVPSCHHHPSCTMRRQHRAHTHHATTELLPLPRLPPTGAAPPPPHCVGFPLMPVDHRRRYRSRRHLYRGPEPSSCVSPPSPSPPCHAWPETKPCRAKLLQTVPLPPESAIGLPPMVSPSPPSSFPFSEPSHYRLRLLLSLPSTPVPPSTSSSRL